MMTIEEAGSGEEHTRRLMRSLDGDDDHEYDDGDGDEDNDGDDGDDDDVDDGDTRSGSWRRAHKKADEEPWAMVPLWVQTLGLLRISCPSPFSPYIRPPC